MQTRGFVAQECAHEVQAFEMGNGVDDSVHHLHACSKVFVFEEPAEDTAPGGQPDAWYTGWFPENIE